MTLKQIIYTKTMEVKELIKELKKYPPNLDVIVWGNDLSDNYNIESLELDNVNEKEVIINVN